VSAEDCIIILDLADADLSQTDEFAKFVADWLFKLRSYGAWAKIIVQGSNYPIKNPAQQDTQVVIERSEWLLWNRIIKLDNAIKSFSMFGDFGADSSLIDFNGSGRAITHLRYAFDDGWLVVRGGKKPQTMKSVVQRITLSDRFSGELYSWGDEFIGTLARTSLGVGNPMIWRAVNMNHHMTLVTIKLSELYGRPILLAAKRRKPVQEDLFLVASEAEGTNPAE
jgi:hypothetical protein